MKKKFCPKCGILFEPSVPGQDYCKPKCRKNDHSARRHYFPQFGGQAKARYILRTYKNILTKYVKEVHVDN